MNIMLEVQCTVPSLAPWVCTVSPCPLSPSPCTALPPASHPQQRSPPPSSANAPHFFVPQNLEKFVFSALEAHLLPGFAPHPVPT